MSDNEMQEFDLLKQEYENILEYKAKGAQIRARIESIEYNEKSNYTIDSEAIYSTTVFVRVRNFSFFIFYFFLFFCLDLVTLSPPRRFRLEN